MTGHCGGTWKLVGVHSLRPNALQEQFRLPAGALLISRDLRHDDGRLLSELIVAHRLPELVDADWRQDDPLHELLEGLPRVFWGEYALGPDGDPSDELYVLHRYPADRREDFPHRTAVGLQAFHFPGLVVR